MHKTQLILHYHNPNMTEYLYIVIYYFFCRFIVVHAFYVFRIVTSSYNNNLI